MGATPTPSARREVGHQVHHTFVLREVRIDDFPESWHADQIGVRSHDSQTYGQRFMLRLDETITQKLQQLVEQFSMSRAEIIRQLIAQAK
jgi:Ribbon-helix-helix protein, copG family